MKNWNSWWANFIKPQKRTIFIFIIFSVLFFLVIGGPLTSTNSWFLFLIALFIFWIKNNKIIQKTINLNSAIYLAIFFVGAILQNLLLNLIHQPFSSQQLIAYPILFFVQISWFLMLFAIGLFLMQESKGRSSYWIVITIYLLLAHHLFFYGQPINRWIFYLLMLAFLMKKTRWLEDLSRAELGVYLLIAFVIFVQFQEPQYFERFRDLAEAYQDSFWAYSLPFFLFYLGKIYLIVIMIKIPLVLIYNFAPISRKLWIAGLFQSTLPQIVQLILLLFIFFLFISGWQANNLKEQIYTVCGKITRGKITTLPVKVVPTQTLFGQINDPNVFKRDLGIVNFNLIPNKAEYLFYRPKTFSNDSLYLIPIDSLFLQQLFQESKLILGSGLIAYKFEPGTFLNYLYRIAFWRSGNIRINPLGLINPFFSLKRQKKFLIWPKNFPSEDSSDFWPWQKLQTYPIIVGRVYFPLEQKDTYFALDIYYDLREFFRWNFMTQVLVVLIFFFFLLNSLVIRRVVKLGTQINQLIVDRIAQLRQAVRAIANGNLDYHVQIAGDDEFSEFAAHFNRMSRQLKIFMEEAREKERLNQELKIAHEVQLKMLPNRLPEIPGYLVAADLITANEVGGDFYDVFALDANRYLIAIGDVSGKGMSAAFYMAQIISLIRYSRYLIEDLKKLILHLNHFLIQEILEQNIFVTIIIGILDLRKENFQFVRAGHPFPIVLSPNSDKPLAEIQTKGIGLGLSKSQKVIEKNLETGKIKLKAGEALILYTDGFTEAAREDDNQINKQMYSEERFKQQLVNCAHLTPNEMINCLNKDLDQFYQQTPRFDDQTILILKKKDE